MNFLTGSLCVSFWSFKKEVFEKCGNKNVGLQNLKMNLINSNNCLIDFD